MVRKKLEKKRQEGTLQAYRQAGRRVHLSKSKSNE
jgi:hypothetical protein